MQAEPPSTPVRGRTTSRYPAALSKGEPGRVPLHRRGTSRTLECMEDLLRENGYKETRVFTPEAERIEAMAEGRRQSTWRIRELLSGWLPGAGGSEPASDDESTPVPNRVRRPTTPTHVPIAHHSTPSSPLSHKRRLDHHPAPHPLSSPNSASSTTLSSIRSMATSEGRTVSYQPTRRQIHDRIPAIRAETSSASLRTYAQVSAARGYLRHMVSTPNMAKRPAPSARDYSMERMSTENPLPASWLESVTKAVLQSGDSTAHVGRPLSRPSSRQSQRPHRASKENKFLFSDQTPKPSRTSGRSASGLPPGATFYLQRPQTAPSAINAAHVVCKSAPGSRSASRVGDRSHGGGGGGSLRGPPRKDRQDRGRRGSRGIHTDRVPSLAATRIENDAWGSSMHWVDGKRVPLLHFDDTSYEDAVVSDDDDDDDEGELDLARLLVPPKRQYSIQSLRKHLHVAHAQRRSVLLTTDQWEEEEGVATRGRSRPVHIDESDGYPTFERTDSKRRRGLPGAWGTGRS
ncbi:hypothetical protein C8Q76DRAFT_735789 [Earliella scabrosa]|nr:hypothetical protein C8Q76DRAFT_735789 [Earliella scabrosa]